MSKNKIKYGILGVCLLAGVLYFALPNFSLEALSITYPYDKAVFPPEITSPVFRWDDKLSGADTWRIRIEFSDGADPVLYRSDSAEWAVERDTWETIKNRSIEKDAAITIEGKKKSLAGKFLTRNKVLSRNSITISTSADSVGAPIFYRDVPLPFDFAREKMELIQWRMGDISSNERPPIVLENLPVCGNCHSFTPDGSTLAMDVDSAGDKGSYVITPIEKNIFMTREKLITWRDYKREENEVTFGLLAQISPCGRYVASGVKDRVIFFGRENLLFSQLFFPVKGIVAIYDREKKEFFALHGADDHNYVQGNPSWSHDSKYVIIARTPITEYLKTDETKNVVLNLTQSAKVLGGKEFLEDPRGGETFTFNMYRIPFNDGRGGTPEPIPGASHNGKSNYFAKYSPDGEWIVFCQARSFMLLQPDSKLYIMPADLSGEPRLMKCNTNRMNSWHSWSPNSRWLVFSSKVNSAYTELFLTHIDEEGNDSPPVLLSTFSSEDRARNIPEFVNIEQGGIAQIYESFVDYYSYARKGNKLIDFGKYEEAEESFRISIDLNPDYGPTHSQLGFVLMRLEREEEAEKELKTALKLDPENPITHQLLGTIYLNRKETEKARKAFETSIRLEPNYALAHARLGTVELLTGNVEEAMMKFETALRYDPALPDALFSLGTIYKDREEYGKAQEAFETILRYNDDVKAYIQLGMVLLLEKNYSRAEDAFGAVLKFDPENTAALHNLGNIYMERKEYNKAERTFLLAYQSNPDNINAIFNLGLIYTNKKEYAKAEQAFRTVYKKNPNNPAACFNLGDVLSKNNNTLSEAIAMFNSGLALLPTNTQAHIDLGNLYLRIGNKAAALNEFRKALQLNPDSNELKAYIAQLSRQ